MLLKSFKLNLSIKFLIFLVLFTQGDIVLKLIGLCFIFIFSGAPIFSNKVSRLEFFFLFMIFYSLTSFFFIPFEGANYFYSWIIGVLFWVICFIAFKQVVYFINKQPSDIIHNTLDGYFIINCLLVFGQYIFLSVQDQTWNPYAYGSLGMSTGDFMKGIFANSSINMIITSFFVAYYAGRKQWGKVALATIVILSTTYMSGIVLFITSLVILLFTSFTISLGRKLTIVLGILSLFAVISFISPENISYVKSNISDIFTKKPPRKIISFSQTLQNSFSGVQEFFYGEGVGRFSSRLAFTTGGEYVSWYPTNITYRSQAFEANHFKLWNKEILSKPYSDGTANQPFSIYNQFLGEYGLIGVFALLFLYLGHFYKKRKQLTYGKLILIAVLGYFLLDYWFEYFSVLLVFEMLMLLDIKTNEKKENTSA